MTGGVVLGIRLSFHDPAPQQRSTFLEFYQPATDEVLTHDLRWTAEEGVGLGWEIFGDGLSGLGNRLS